MNMKKIKIKKILCQITTPVDLYQPELYDHNKI